MKVLRLLHLTIAGAFYRWAMAEIDPLHPDLPRILVRQSQIRDQTKDLFA